MHTVFSGSLPPVGPKRRHVVLDSSALVLVRSPSDYGSSPTLTFPRLFFSNFVIAITFPRLLGAFKPQGAFGWYAAWNVVGFFLVLLFVPETKALSLEELDQGE